VHLDCPVQGTNAVHFAAHGIVVDVHGDEQALVLLLALLEYFQVDNIAAGCDGIAGLARVGTNIALEEHVCPLNTPHSSTRVGPSPAEHTETDRPSSSTRRRACNEGLSRLEPSNGYLNLVSLHCYHRISRFELYSQRGKIN